MKKAYFLFKNGYLLKILSPSKLFIALDVHGVLVEEHILAYSSADYLVQMYM